jgi:predicted  nucleic acid-binding Zn-ribbon protein
MRNDSHLHDDIADAMDFDDDTIGESTSDAAKALEKSYNDRIKMAETRAKLAEKETKDLKDLFKKVSEQLKTYSEALERDETSFDAIGEAFEGLGYPKYATQCKEKASYIRDLLARHRAFLAHIKTLVDTI